MSPINRKSVTASLLGVGLIVSSVAGGHAAALAQDAGQATAPIVTIQTESAVETQAEALTLKAVLAELDRQGALRVADTIVRERARSAWQRVEQAVAEAKAAIEAGDVENEEAMLAAIDALKKDARHALNAWRSQGRQQLKASEDHDVLAGALQEVLNQVQRLEADVEDELASLIGQDGDDDANGTDPEDENDENGADPEDENETEPDDENGTDPEDENGTDPEDENEEDPGDENGTEPEDENGTDPEDENGSDPDDEDSSDPDDENGTDPEDENGTEPDDENGVDPNEKSGLIALYQKLVEAYNNLVKSYFNLLFGAEAGSTQ